MRPSESEIAEVYEVFQRNVSRLYRAQDAGIATATFSRNAFEGGGFFSSGSRWKRPPSMRGMGKMPNPRGTSLIGPLHSIAYVAMKDGRPTGEVGILRPARTILLWSPSLQAEVAFPGRRLGPPVEKASRIPAALEAYRTFHQGREPWGGSWMEQPEPPFGPPCWAISTAYQSDKFDERGKMTLYVHMHEPGVMVFDGTNHEGRAICVRGGELALTAHGISG
jgi:hypothetical protein